MCAGTISGDTKTGSLNEKDFVTRVIQTILQQDSFPKSQSAINLCPVDFVSQAIVYLSMQKMSIGQTFHLVNPTPTKWKDITDAAKSFRPSLAEMEFLEWRKLVMNAAAKDPKHPLGLLLSHLGMDFPSSRDYKCSNTTNVLKAANLQCPTISKDIVCRYLSFLNR